MLSRDSIDAKRARLAAFALALSMSPPALTLRSDLLLASCTGDGAVAHRRACGGGGPKCQEEHVLRVRPRQRRPVPWLAAWGLSSRRRRRVGGLGRGQQRRVGVDCCAQRCRRRRGRAGHRREGDGLHLCLLVGAVLAPLQGLGRATPNNRGAGRERRPGAWAERGLLPADRVRSRHARARQGRSGRDGPGDGTEEGRGGREERQCRKHRQHRRRPEGGTESDRSNRQKQRKGKKQQHRSSCPRYRKSKRYRCKTEGLGPK